MKTYKHTNAYKTHKPQQQQALQDTNNIRHVQIRYNHITT